MENEMNDVVLQKINSVYVKILAEQNVLRELSDVFTFNVPNFKFMKKKFYNNWDGKIRLLNTRNNLIYQGLVEDIKDFCKVKDYSFEYLKSDCENENIDIDLFLKSLKLPEKINNQSFQVRDYQIETLKTAIKTPQRLFLSPTSSGKSLMIYLITKFFSNKKTLIIVPTTTLVHQLESDFKEYGSKEKYHLIYSGKDKNISDRVVISTWQSLYTLDKNWFHQFDMVIGDEAHLYKANSLKYIMENLVNAEYRFGFTGTLDGLFTNEMVLKGLFGPICKVTTIKNLVENKQIADFQIKTILLKYSEEEKKANHKNTYQDEIEFLVNNEKRNQFITDLSIKTKGNTILFFQYVEKHGKVLYELIKNKLDSSRKLFFISGEIDGEERNKIREIVEKENDCIIVASYGTSSTGISIRKIRNLIFASPSKSRVKVLQSIGRGLRLSNDPSTVTIFDIADDISYKSKENHTLRHLKKRIEIYNEENFNFKLSKYEL